MKSPLSAPAPSTAVHRIHVRKEALKFSAAHMTVFPDGSKESLHGHNYTTELTVELSAVSLQDMVPFSELKAHMKAICVEWDEKVLLPARCPHFKRLEGGGAVGGAGVVNEVEFTLCGKRYVLPADEVVLLPVDNVTTETLSEEFGRRWLERFNPARFKQVTSVSIRVEEFPGQGASYEWRRER